ncbi:flagellar export chaperone FliS [Priestia taiwanensis]|uniref:Flagellar secretion chaperone FliS n=1 Tax=Priestia taiwanensis TaxID=1347902 RepID=A0A917ETV9_9BACI|nr:flagellar export chaperone FliS [Priestia taiwanensis]MBM7364391.1 flagellar protein FliS [Priestia taiwanensis]GGE81754.1 flagellar protein FliS [Priestia taiwanensis]
MGMRNPYEAYQQNTVTTKSPGELTLMLYEGCLKFLGRAKVAMDQKNIQVKNENIQKSQAIIHELMVTLNKEVELSKDLLSLYEYMNRQLIQANIKNDVALIEEVEGFVREFRDTWKQVIHIYRQQQHTTGGQA